MSKDLEEARIGVLSTMKQVVKNEGVIGLYNGLSARLFESVLSSALLFYSKEVLYNWLTHRSLS